MPLAEALFDAVRAGDAAKVSELIGADPSLVNVRNELGQSAILLAKYHRKPELVDVLLRSGAQLDIHEAAAVGEEARVRSLLSTDRTLLDSYSQDGFTPLALASFFGNPAIAKHLLDQGADVNAVSRNPMSIRPLHAAVAGRHGEIVRMLVEHGADVNARQQQGYTPLHAAAHSGDEELVRLLLAHGAHRNSRTDAGQTPLDLALTQGHAAVVNLLEAA